jgi:aryl-phospho-beta-D-glucosidase BglC (GH1 family)
MAPATFMPMRTLLIHRLVVLVLASSLAREADAFVHASGRNMVDSQGKIILWKGFGLGEWMNIENYFWGDMPGEDVGSPSKPTWGHSAIRAKLTQLMGQADADAFYARWTANIITEKDVAQYAGWGVNSIRVSLNWHWFTSADGVWIEDGFRMLDSLVGWGERYGVYIIPCLHAAPGGQGNELMSDVADGNPRLWTEAAKYQPWAIALWKKIAERYADREWVGGYDLLDEPLPPDGSNTKALLPFYKQLTAAIRAVDKNHLIIAEGVQWAQDFAGLESPWDANMAYSFHHYDFDSPGTNDDAGYADWNSLAAKSGKPLWNGETGEPDYGSDAKNNAWAKETDAYCTRKGYGWSWWTTKKVGQKTNPYTIAAPAGFEKIIAAFKGTALSRSEAVPIMMALADNAATSRCARNTALIEALGFCASCPPAAPRVPVAVRPGLAAEAGSFALMPRAGERWQARFALVRPARVRIDLFDARGERVFRGNDVPMPAGDRTLEIPGRAVPGGMLRAVLFLDGARTAASAFVLR